MGLIWSGLGRPFAFAASAFAACLAGGDVGAQGRLEAKYIVTLAGLPIGKGSWVVEIGDDQYTATGSGATAGLIKIFTSGRGTSGSRGFVRGDSLLPTAYVSNVNNDTRAEEVRIALNAGMVKDLVVEPPPMPNPDRVPVTDAHRRGVIDPMSATLIRVPGNGELITPEVCRRTLPIFDGRMRFDLHLSFKRFEQVEAEKGYRGPVAVCSVQFTPLAGHVPDRAAIKYLTAERDMEIWLAPIAGTRIMAPYHISLRTPLGQGVLEATQFVSTPGPSRVPPATAAR
jgi:Protein of unknown function (DUF3108)